MKIPCLPLFIDEFSVPSASVNSPQTECKGMQNTLHLFLLSHFHTDHMKGLTWQWRGGPIICSVVTRALLIQKFGDAFAERIFSLPFWCRTRLLSGSISEAQWNYRNSPQVDADRTTGPPSIKQEARNYLQIPKEAREVSTDVFVTLLPAFHIPGSAMFYLETCMGSILYTGDFKFHCTARRHLNPFLEHCTVDHVYLDDTWLHLGKCCMVNPECRTDHLVSENTQCGEKSKQETRKSDRKRTRKDGMVANVESMDTPGKQEKILTHLLNDEQMSEAFEGVRRRMVHQSRLFSESHLENYSGTTVHGDGFLPSSSNCLVGRPYHICVYLHNQFGKEMLVQRLAIKLGTRILLDDQRYDRLAAVENAWSSEKCGVPESSHFSVNEFHKPDDREDGKTRNHSETSSIIEHCRKDWQRIGGEEKIYGVNVKYFISVSQFRKEVAHVNGTTIMNADNDFHSSAPTDRCRGLPPGIEIVSRRDEISSEKLSELSRKLRTPHYAIIMSGWANHSKVVEPSSSLDRATCWPSSSSHGTEETSVEASTWHVPTTLHCTPQEIIDLIALLRPMSVTPFHYTPAKDLMVLKRLGPYLKVPYHNQYLKHYGGPQEMLSRVNWNFSLSSHSFLSDTTNSVAIMNIHRHSFGFQLKKLPQTVATPLKALKYNPSAAAPRGRFVLNALTSESESSSDEDIDDIALLLGSS